MDPASLLRRAEMLRGRQSEFISDWQHIVRYAAPQLAAAVDGGRGSVTIGGAGQSVDATAKQAVETLVTGLDGFIFRGDVFNVTPKVDVRDDPDATAWADAAEIALNRAVQHRNSGWVSERMKALRSVVALGTGAVGIGDDGRRLSFEAVPVNDLAFCEDATGRIDTVYRWRRLTARQAVAAFGSQCPEHISSRMETDPYGVHEFVHAVFPIGEDDARGVPSQMRYASYWVSVTGRQIARRQALRTMYYAVGRWGRVDGTAWGWGPVQVCLDDVRRLNRMTADTLRAANRMIDPSTYVRDGVFTGRIDNSPGAINFYHRSIGDGAEVRAWPGPVSLPYVNEEVERTRQQLREGLFYYLLQRPQGQMTATEWLGREAETYRHLSGPAAMIAGEIGDAVAVRAFDIILFAGAVPPPPPPFTIHDFIVEVLPPIMRMEHAQQLDRGMRFLTAAGTIAQADASALEALDADRILADVREYCDAPEEWLRPPRDVAEMRQARARRQQQQEAMESAPQLAAAAKDARAAGINVASMLSGRR